MRLRSISSRGLPLVEPHLGPIQGGHRLLLTQTKEPVQRRVGDEIVVTSEPGEFRAEALLERVDAEAGVGGIRWIARGGPPEIVTQATGVASPLDHLPLHV